MSDSTSRECCSSTDARAAREPTCARGTLPSRPKQRRVRPRRRLLLAPGSRPRVVLLVRSRSAAKRGPRPAFVLACAHESGTALCPCARDRSRAVSNRHRSPACVALRAARPSATRRLSTCGASPLREEVRSRCPRLLAQHAAARVIHVKREAGRTPDPPHVTVCSGSAHPFDPSSLFRVDT
jgi:hypothetical protein